MRPYCKVLPVVLYNSFAFNLLETCVYFIHFWPLLYWIYMFSSFCYKRKIIEPVTLFYDNTFCNLFQYRIPSGADWDKISGREISHSSRPSHTPTTNSEIPICMTIT